MSGNNILLQNPKPIYNLYDQRGQYKSRHRTVTFYLHINKKKKIKKNKVTNILQFDKSTKVRLQSTLNDISNT